MKPQYPIEPEVTVEVVRRAIKDLDFYDGRRLCTDDRLIRDAWTYESTHMHDPVIVKRMACALAWYRGTPVTVRIKYNDGATEVIVVEPSDIVEDVVVRFVRYISAKRQAYSQIVTMDIKRIANRIMDLQMREGEFSVSLMIAGTSQPFFTHWFSNDAEWKLLGPNRTKIQVEQDLLKNFNEIMEDICLEINGARGSSYDPHKGVYTFWLWNKIVHECNIERVKRALMSTGWTVVSLKSVPEGVKLVIK